MEKKEVKDNSNNDGHDNKLSDDPLGRQIDDNTFEIRINIKLRMLGVRKITLTKQRLTIDAYEDTIVSVSNYKDIRGLYSRLEDQLANHELYLSPQFIDNLWNFLNKAKPSIGRIVQFFQNREIKGDCT
jgi:hypothetical protein